MHRTQIYLDGYQKRMLDKYAEHLETSRSKLIRDAIDNILKKLKKKFVYKTPSTSWDSIIGIADSGDKHSSQKIDEVVYDIHRK